MNTDALVAQVIDALNASGVAYVVTGSLASNVYGVARMTKDADFILQISGDEIATIARTLQPSFRLDRQMAFETITASHKYVLEHAESAFVAEFFLLNDDPFNQQRFSRRRRAIVLDRPVWLPTPEDVVIQKLRWSRPHDIEDARNVLKVQCDSLEWAYIRSWCERHGTLGRLDQLLGEIRAKA